MRRLIRTLGVDVQQAESFVNFPLQNEISYSEELRLIPSSNAGRVCYVGIRAHLSADNDSIRLLFAHMELPETKYIFISARTCTNRC